VNLPAVGVRVPPCRPLDEIVQLAVRAEALGVSGLWIPDSPINFRDVWATLGSLAVSTSRIGLVASVTNVVTRHPSVTASAAATLAETVPGRFVLGLGAGDSSIGHNGLRHSTTAELRAGIAELRSWIRGDPVGPPHSAVHLRHGGAEVPLYLAASGPNNIRVAAEHADGLICSLAGLDREFVDRVERISAAAGRLHRPHIVAVGVCHPTDDLERDASLLAPIVVRVAQLQGTEIFERAGVIVRPPDHRVGAVGDVGHAVDARQAAEISSRFVTPEAVLWYAQNCALFGSADMIADRLRDLGGLVDTVVLAHLGASALPHEVIELLGREVLPRLRDAAADDATAMTLANDHTAASAIRSNTGIK
jgi:5,10-methylenetetrahydromethanopterin reductase